MVALRRVALELVGVANGGRHTRSILQAGDDVRDLGFGFCYAHLWCRKNWCTGEGIRILVLLACPVLDGHTLQSPAIHLGPPSGVFSHWVVRFQNCPDGCVVREYGEGVPV